MFNFSDKNSTLVGYMPIESFSSFTKDIHKNEIYSRFIKSVSGDCIMLEMTGKNEKDPDSYICYIESGHGVIGSNKISQSDIVKKLALENKKKKTVTVKVIIKMEDKAAKSYYKTQIEEGELKKYKEFFKYDAA